MTDPAARPSDEGRPSHSQGSPEGPHFLAEHLNVNWLRPESALWDAIASAVVSKHEFRSPSLDVGSGNGIFSFITAGGTFSPEYDWYRNTDPEGFWDNRDIYDALIEMPTAAVIVRRAAYRIDWALDHKINLASQASALDFYHGVLVADANRRWPFADEFFATVFSNILYWLDSPDRSLREVWRVLRPGGQALLCLQDERFTEYCVSYQWQQRHSELLRLINRGREALKLWTISYADLRSLAVSIGFKIVAHTYYLSPLTLRCWDIGLRPLSPVLIRMSRMLNDECRLAVKVDWINTVHPLLRELYEMDSQSTDQGGFHFVCLEKP